MIKLGISACLLGQNVRYDGKNKFINLGQYFDPAIYELTPICPEVEMGMSIPRPSIQMRIIDGDTRLVQVNNHQLDFTDQLNGWFEENQQRFEQFQGFILKSKSPSCGNQTTPHFDKVHEFVLKDGLFVSQIKSLPIIHTFIDENDLNNPTKLDVFKKSLI